MLNVASTAAFQPGPFMAVYYASKAYVLQFHRSAGGRAARNRRHRDLPLSRGR